MIQPTEDQIKGVFNQTANAIAGDLMECLRQCGEEPIVSRDACYDYLGIHGGKDGDLVYQYVMDYPGELEDLEAHLDQIGVPKSWA